MLATNNSNRELQLKLLRKELRSKDSRCDIQTTRPIMEVLQKFQRESMIDNCHRKAEFRNSDS